MKQVLSIESGWRAISPRVLLVVLALGGAIQSGHAASNTGGSAAQVRLWQETLPGKVIYHYRMRNLEPGSTIAGLVVGYDYQRRMLQLKPRLPAGSRICSPDGWSGEVVNAGDNSTYQITWGSRDADFDLKGGEELAGFAVQVPTANDSLRNSYFSADFSSGKSTFASAPVIISVPSGATAPLLNCVDPVTGKMDADVRKDDVRKDAGTTGDGGGCDD